MYRTEIEYITLLFVLVKDGNRTERTDLEPTFWQNRTELELSCRKKICRTEPNRTR